VGKTALHTRFFRDEFSLPYISTIGVEFGIKTIEMCGQRIKLQGITLSPSLRARSAFLDCFLLNWVGITVWDTTGQERFRSIMRAYYRGSRGLVVVYDVTNRSSWEHAKYWINEVQRNLPDDVDMMPFLLGTPILRLALVV